MLPRFLRLRTPPAPPPAVVPAGQRVYAIGDIHGRLDLLDELVAAIDADAATRGAARTTYVFLGDLVDRGPNSSGVVDRVAALMAERADVRLLMGNHEEIFLAALSGDEKALRLFCRVGGRETAISYGIDAAEYEAMDYPALAERLAALVPEAHRTLLAAAEDMVVIGDYAFVHAGVRPTVALDAQSAADLRWIRGPFLDHRDRLAKMIVHGHTISDAIAFRPHRIGIDTGAYATGRLTALGLEGEDVWHVETRCAALSAG